MASAQPAEFTAILKTIRHWPPDARRGLMNEIFRSLVEEERAPFPRGFSADQVVGLLKTDAPAPTDEDCERILEEELMKKYGQ